MFVGAGTGQLWGLLVVTSVDPRFWAEKGTDRGKLEEVESRQLDGVCNDGRQSVGERADGGADGSGNALIRSAAAVENSCEGQRGRRRRRQGGRWAGAYGGRQWAVEERWEEG